MTQQQTGTSEGQDMAQTCPNCGMTREEWQNDGQGYEYGGTTYCCQGCADGTGCTC
jgi:hypothetical protein